MNEKPVKPESHPFQKFTQFARKIIAVPKSEADEKEKEWQKGREEKKRAKKAA